MASSADEARIYFSKVHKEVYGLANSEQPISKKTTFALKVIEESFERYGYMFDNIIFYLYDKDLTGIQALYVTHPNPFSEVDEFVEECEKRYCLNIVKIEGSMKPALIIYLKQKPNIKAILVGTRRNDPHGGKLKEFTPTDDGWPSIMRVHPILDMHYTQIWEFLRTLNVPYCVLYDLGYTSLGSQDNTYPNPDLERSDGYYDPAWKLTDESRERCGRENKTRRENKTGKDEDENRKGEDETRKDEDENRKGEDETSKDKGETRKDEGETRKDKDETRKDANRKVDYKINK